MEKNDQTQKANKPKKMQNNFISAIASGASLNTLEALEKKDEIQSKENEVPVTNVDQVSTSNNVTETAPEPAKKPKGKNNNEFVENIIALHENNPFKSKEKVTLHTSPQIHYKLKMVAFASKVNLLDLSNAILANYLISNKDEIDALIKKMSL